MRETAKITMRLHWRHMQPKDVSACVDIIAADPVVGPRYGAAIADLAYAWHQLLGSAALTPYVFEQMHEKRQRIVGAGVGVFVSDDFICEVKTPPLIWFGPELARSAVAKNSPVLSDKQVRIGNSRDGLNQMVWELVVTPEIRGNAEFDHVLLESYIEIHRGFRFKELITSQSWGAERIQWALDAGGLYWNPVCQRYEKTLPEPAESFAARPYIVGITRALELARRGSWVGTLFDYHPPQFGLSQGEQQLLLTALASSGGTDRELADALGLSVPTVKKRWGSIYSRVNACDSELIPDSALAEAGTFERGREKKRSVLAYVREHPEELRLHSRKLVTENLQRPNAD